MRFMKPLLAAVAVLTLAVPALASAEPSWGWSGGHNDGGYRDGGYRGDYARIRFLREREFERQQALQHARWQWRHDHDGYRYRNDRAD